MGIPGALPQQRLGRYELLARLATGGMGEIFLARLEGAAGFEKLYVVKRILPHLADDARFRQMLIAEARIAAKMSHANICQVYELGETDGQLYIVMEYLEGITMLPLLRKASKEATPLDFGFVAGLLQQTCDALHYAHELKDRDGEGMGLVHRDVSPSNIFLTESGVAKILDFGIAKARGASTNTQEGTVKGKYAYMAPEQLRGGAIDRRVDVFALGVVMYEMIALRRLFQRKTDYLTFRAVMEQPIPDIRRYRADCPDSLAEALARALDRDPTQRYENARQLGTAMLDAFGTVKRPWGQGEISDFVRANFADDIGKRSKQVQSVVHRTKSGADARSTMPLIAHPDNEQPSEDTDDDGFPSVETDVDSPFSRTNRTPSGIDFQGQTPPPFSGGGDSNPSNSGMIRPVQGTPVLQPATNSQPIMVVPRRSLVWPLLAAAMVLIAGGALFLVWRQMQQQPPQMGPVIIRQGPDPRPIEKDNPAQDGSGSGGVNLADGSDASHAGSATPPDDKIPHNPHPTPPPPHRPKTVKEALASGLQGATECVNANGGPNGLPNGTATISIAETKAGVPTDVKLMPPALDAGALGACVRKVYMAIRFPPGNDGTITFDLNLRPPT